MNPDFPATHPVDRLPRLDVLRGIAILLVFVFHYCISLIGPFADAAKVARPGDWIPAIDSEAYRISQYGESGVALFFVLSGFCIHLAFLRSRRAFAVADFYWRRFVRIYPAYFLALMIFSVLGAFRILTPLNLKMFLSHALLLHNFFDAKVFLSINAAFWSLAIEWQFYLLYPLVLLVRRRSNLLTCLWLSIAICVLEQVLCWLSPAFAQFTQERFLAGRTLVTWCDWILGACLAESYCAGKLFFRRPFFWAAGGLILVMAMHDYPFVFGFSFLVKSLFWAAVMEGYLASKRPLLWIERLLIPIGLISYSIYLWHMPLIKPLWRYLHALVPLPITIFGEFFFFLPLTALILSPVFLASYWVGEKWLPDYLRRLR